MDKVLSFFYLHWNPIWGVIIYFFRAVQELYIGRSRVSRGIKLEKLKAVGPDLYWMGMAVWGTLLVNPDPRSYFCSVVNPISEASRVFSPLVLVFLFFGGIFVSWWKKKEEKSPPEIKTKGNIMDYIFNALIHIFGVGCFLGAFLMMLIIK